MEKRDIIKVDNVEYFLMTPEEVDQFYEEYPLSEEYKLMIGDTK